MDIIVIDKTVVESLNAMNTGHHKLNIMMLKDGTFYVPAKVLNEPLFEKYKKYLDGCPKVTESKDNVFKPEIILNKK